MKDAQKPDHVSLNTLVNYLRDGRFVIPDFQREFEWKPWDIRELMRSIFLDYYIGSLLLWKGKAENFSALSCEAIYGYQGSGKPEYIVLDGQQRLTAIYYAFLAPDVPLPNRSNRFFYFVHVDKFMAEEYDEAFGYEWLTRRWAKVLANKEDQYASHLFPFSVIGATGWELPNWVQGYEAFWKAKVIEAEKAGDENAAKLAQNHANDATAFGEHLQGITGQYQISYIELDKDLEVDKVCDIFTQINSRGIRLDVFDLVNALLKPKGLQLKKMWRDAAPRLDEVETEKMNVYILQVMSILRQSYCSPKYLYSLLPVSKSPSATPTEPGEKKYSSLTSQTSKFAGMPRSMRWKERSRFSSIRRSTALSVPLFYPMSPFFRCLRPCAPMRSYFRLPANSTPVASCGIGIGLRSSTIGIQDRSNPRALATSLTSKDGSRTTRRSPH